MESSSSVQPSFEHLYQLSEGSCEPAPNITIELLEDSLYRSIDFKTFVNLLQPCEKSDNESNDKKFKCSFENCDLSFSYKSTLNRHLLKFHKIDNRNLPIKCCVFDCEFGFKSKRDLVKHLNFCHKMEQFKLEQKIFESYQHFLTFKLELEEESNCNFSKPTGSKDLNQLQLFDCCRSGNTAIKSLDKRKKDVSFKGTVKINSICPAFMTLKSLDGKY